MKFGYTETPRTRAQRKAMKGTSKKVAVYESRREVLEEIEPASTLILDF